MIRVAAFAAALFCATTALAKEVPLSAAFTGTWSDQAKQHFCILDIADTRQPRVHFACQIGPDAVVVDSRLTAQSGSWDFPMMQRKNGFNLGLASRQDEWLVWGHVYRFTHCRDRAPKMVMLIQKGLDVVEIELQPLGFSPHIS